MTMKMGNNMNNIQHEQRFGEANIHVREASTDDSPFENLTSMLSRWRG